MKILVITGLARTLVLFRFRLLETMAKAGHTVIACAPEDDPAISRKLQAIGVAYRTIPLQRAGLNPISDLRFLWQIIQLLRRERPAVVFSYTIKSVVYASLAARLAGVTQVYSMISGLGYAFSGQTLWQQWIFTAARLLYRPALAGNRAVFFQNPDDRALFLGLGLVRDRNRTVLINGSGVDLEDFAEAPFPPEPIRFLLIARMLKDKGVREYVEAAQRVKQRHPGVTFRLVGPLDANPTSVRPEQIESWKREGVVECQEWVEDVRPVIADSSVFVLPSYREGTPHAVLEAMAMGRPIITTDAPGCRETVRDGENGFIVPVQSAPALASAMERFVQDPGLIPRMGRRSRQLVEEKYDVREVNEVILRAMDLIPEAPGLV